MEKSKLGISIALFSALLFFIGVMGGVLAVMIATGYVLFFEENLYLKKTTIKALVITIGFSIFSTLVMLLTQFIGSEASVLLSNTRMYVDLSMPDDYNNIVRFFTNMQFITGFFNIIMRFLEILILVMLGFRTYKQKSLGLKLIDKILDKHVHT
jgi:hypothetical protein